MSTEYEDFQPERLPPTNEFEIPREEVPGSAGAGRIDETEWLLGPEQPLVTVLEYGDFQCAHCAAALAVLENLIAENPETVRLVFRHFPIPALHPDSVRAALAAEAAGAQGQFWDMHDMLFTHQSKLAEDDLAAYAKDIGLDLARFHEDMRASRTMDAVREDFRRGLQQGVKSTPSLFLNGRFYDGPRDRLSSFVRFLTRHSPLAVD